MRILSLVVLLCVTACRDNVAPEPVTIHGEYTIEAAGVSGSLVLRDDLTFTETANGQTATGDYALTLPDNGLVLFPRTSIATETMTGTKTLTPSGTGEFTRSGNGVTVVYRKQ